MSWAKVIEASLLAVGFLTGVRLVVGCPGRYDHSHRFFNSCRIGGSLAAVCCAVVGLLLVVL